MTAREFAFYPPEGAHWCSRADYGHMLDVVRAHRARRILEFGPGTSTLALIEGGAQHIDCCEDDPEWYAVWVERLQARFPDVVHMRAYTWRPILHIEGVNGNRYDLAVIDGPHSTERRAAPLVYSLINCDRVLVALEEQSEPGHFRPVVERYARTFRRSVDIVQTGPLAGAYALIGPP